MQLAPARANSRASAPLDIPPHPMIGIFSGRWARRVLKALRDSGKSGVPERPPVSCAEANVVSYWMFESMV